MTPQPYEYDRAKHREREQQIISGEAISKIDFATGYATLVANF